MILDPDFGLAYVDPANIAEHMLSDYNVQQKLLEELPARIAAIDSKLFRIESGYIQQSGTGESVEEIRARQTCLEEELRRARKLVSAIDEALEKISKEHAEILRIKYIYVGQYDYKGRWVEVCEHRLHLGQSTVYRAHTEALKEFAQVIFHIK